MLISWPYMPFEINVSMQFVMVIFTLWHHIGSLSLMWCVSLNSFHLFYLKKTISLYSFGHFLISSSFLWNFFIKLWADCNASGPNILAGFHPHNGCIRTAAFGSMRLVVERINLKSLQGCVCQCVWPGSDDSEIEFRVSSLWSCDREMVTQPCHIVLHQKDHCNCTFTHQELHLQCINQIPASRSAYIYI